MSGRRIRTGQDPAVQSGADPTDPPHPEEFIEVLTEIDRYQQFCREHPDYPNSRATHAIANIGRVYDERLQKHDFL